MSNRNSGAETAQSLTEFDGLTLRARTRIEVRRAVRADLPHVFEFAKGSLLDGIAGKKVIAGVMEQNRNSILLFYRNANVVGFWAMLMLTARGLEDLLLGELNTLAPDRECLAVTQERPAAIYNWAIVAPGLASEGVYHVSQFLQKPRYRNANLYSRPNTKSGVKFNLRLGARPIPANQNGLYRYVRLANKTLALSRVA